MSGLYRRLSLLGLVFVLCTTLFILVVNPRDSKTLQYLGPTLNNDESYDLALNGTNTVLTVGEMIRSQRHQIASELSDYRWIKGTRLENYTLALGGTPYRTVIVTTWRSGSTFLGDVFNALPGNFYHYEPLLDYGIMQVREPPHSTSAVRVLRKLLHCDYYNLEHYLDYGKSHVYLFTHNHRLWAQCEAAQAAGMGYLCWRPEFLSAICREFPFQSMKVVRLRLKLAEELLLDDSLNVKVILLIRDPRGTLQSRKHRDWCPTEPDCEQPSLLCQDMVADYIAAVKLQRDFPERFRAIRYEDLSSEPEKNIAELFDFLSLDFHADVRQFLQSHTKQNVGGVSSTYRDSKAAPYHWRVDLTFSEVRYIENMCERAMNLWGYVPAPNMTALKEFNPVTDYELSENFGREG